MFVRRIFDFGRHPRRPAAATRARLVVERLENRQLLDAHHLPDEWACPICQDIWDGGGGTIEICCWIKDIQPLATTATSSMTRNSNADQRRGIASLGQSVGGVSSPPSDVVPLTNLPGPTLAGSEHRDRNLPADGVNPQTLAAEFAESSTPETGSSGLRGKTVSVSGTSPSGQVSANKELPGSADGFWVLLTSGRETLPGPLITSARWPEPGPFSPGDRDLSSTNS